MQLRLSLTSFAAAFVTAGVGLADDSLALVGVAVVLLVLAFAFLKNARLHAARPGSTRIETVQGDGRANSTVRQYANAGWELVGQSSSHVSRGSKPKITLTFRKS